MKSNTKIFAVIRFIVSLILAVGLKSFLQPCIHEDGNYGSCNWAGVMIFGLALLMCILSLFGILFGDARVRLGVGIAALPVVILTFLTPGILIPLCMMDTMRCLSIMKPAVMLISVIILIISLLDIYTAMKK